ncbi:hypothetical protein KOR34_52500 [Posidoniimonas corsicana]|uniref:LamG-like jellyroll fold domain-containing protein n=1 Tax=Posidoniimonas corsicana TaxID=1938618 RepID=A0A5C5UUW5_9BACT|nr:LamG domain-containing protein [Posidoniimonas corsicana]TWT29340.1 hypothetical protein KOR34_52500 [Posidoniimonas corsicana]
MLVTMPARRTATLLAFAATVAAASVSQAVKVHSYTFNDGTANDSTGDADGTLIDPAGIAFYSGGQLRLTNNNGANSNQDFTLSTATGAYVDLPNFTVTDAAFFGTAGQVSLEFWATIQENRNWARLGDFGTSNVGENSSTGGGGSDYIIVVPQTGLADNPFAASTHQQDGMESFVQSTGPLTTGQEHHVVVTIDQTDTTVNANGTLNLYLNGALVNSGPVVGAGTAAPIDITNMNEVNSWLGRAQWADPLFDGSYNEFNVYDHALSAGEVTANFNAGPVPGELAVPTLVIDRLTGEMMIANQTGEQLQLTGFRIDSAAGSLDPTASNGFGNITLNPDTEELIVGASASSQSIGASTSQTLGAAWNQSSIEDIGFKYTLQGGTEQTGEVQFVNVDGGFSRSDLDTDGDIDADDFDLFAANTHTDLSGLSAYELAIAGDLNGDGANNYIDFRLFKDDFIAANGAAAFAALGAAPEPTAVVLLALSGLGLTAVRRR